MSEIKSKIHNYGHEHESEWPSRFGTQEKGRFKKDPETGEIKSVREIRKAQELHYVIQDTLKEPTYSASGDILTDSRSQLKQSDLRNGIRSEFGVTYDRKPLPDHNVREAEEIDRRNDIEQAYYDIKYDRVFFTEKQKECFKREERKWQEYKKRQR